jgi:hypothetical protein
MMFAQSGRSSAPSTADGHASISVNLIDAAATPRGTNKHLERMQRRRTTGDSLSVADLPRASSSPLVQQVAAAAAAAKPRVLRTQPSMPAKLPTPPPTAKADETLSRCAAAVVAVCMRLSRHMHWMHQPFLPACHDVVPLHTICVLSYRAAANVGQGFMRLLRQCLLHQVHTQPWLGHAQAGESHLKRGFHMQAASFARNPRLAQLLVQAAIETPPCRAAARPPLTARAPAVVPPAAKVPTGAQTSRAGGTFGGYATSAAPRAAAMSRSESLTSRAGSVYSTASRATNLAASTVSSVAPMLSSRRVTTSGRWS